MKNLMRLTAVVMMLCVMLCLAACGGDSNPTTAAPTTPTTKPATVPTTTAAPTSTGFVAPEHTYRFKVVDQNGDIVVGATVQLCLESCMFKPTEVDGYAYFNSPVADGYKVQVLAVPEGYTCNSEEVIYLEPGQTEITLIVTKN